MFGLGMPEIIVILVVALIIFGPDKLPEMARSIGKGIAEFKSLTTGVERQMKDEFEAIIKDGEEAPKASSSTMNIGGQPKAAPKPTDPPNLKPVKTEAAKKVDSPSVKPAPEPEENTN